MVYVNPQFQAAPSSSLAGRELSPTVVKQGTVNPQFQAAPSSTLAGRELCPTVVKQGTDGICESPIPSCT